MRRVSVAFTLFDLMVVIVLIGILAGTIIPVLINKLEKGKLGWRPRADVQVLADAVQHFRMDQGRWPVSLGELAVRPSDAKSWPAGGYLYVLHKDPWGHDYVLQRPAPDGRDFDIVSFGKDGIPGGDGLDADISYVKSGK